MRVICTIVGVVDIVVQRVIIHIIRYQIIVVVIVRIRVIICRVRVAGVNVHVGGGHRVKIHRHLAVLGGHEVHTRVVAFVFDGQMDIICRLMARH